MKKLLIGALAAAGLVFAGCERSVQGTSDDGIGGAGTQEAEHYEPSLHPSPTGTGGAGEYEGQLEQEQPVQQEQPVIEDPELQEQDELDNQRDATGGAGFEDERDLEGIDGSGRESTRQDHAGDESPPAE